MTPTTPRGRRWTACELPIIHAGVLPFTERGLSTDSASFVLFVSFVVPAVPVHGESALDVPSPSRWGRRGRSRVEKAPPRSQSNPCPCRPTPECLMPRLPSSFAVLLAAAAVAYPAA